jgi:hypothetical protein
VGLTEWEKKFQAARADGGVGSTNERHARRQELESSIAVVQSTLAQKQGQYENLRYIILALSSTIREVCHRVGIETGEEGGVVVQESSSPNGGGEEGEEDIKRTRIRERERDALERSTGAKEGGAGGTDPLSGDKDVVGSFGDGTGGTKGSARGGSSATSKRLGARGSPTSGSVQEQETPETKEKATENVAENGGDGDGGSKGSRSNSVANELSGKPTPLKPAAALGSHAHQKALQKRIRQVRRGRQREGAYSRREG